LIVSNFSWQNFLLLMSLRTGTELSTLVVLLNKFAGIFGLLAILTGLQLSALQLSMYIYSIIGLVTIAILAPHIRKQSPFQCLALAWFFLLDSIISACYTAAFAMNWFLVISQHHTAGNEGSINGAADSVKDAAGFTDPKYNVSRVEVIARPGGVGHEAVAVGHGTGPATSSGGPTIAHGVLQAESLPSLIILLLLWTIRFYCVLVVMAYVRQVLMVYMVNNPPSSPDVRASPFSQGAEFADGLKGKLGRFMVSIGRGYWLGNGENEEWARGIGGKFRKSGEPLAPGTRERESRRRSGTGPPAPKPEVFNGQIPR
jgi:inositol phosphorylceramide synthase regulatory subunit